MKHFKSLGLACLSSLTFLVAAQPSYALGLGTIQVQSFLNQPLRAEIPIKEKNEVALSEIQIKLASPDEFEKAGIDRAYFLTKFNYDVVERDGQAYIEITSKEPIQNPFISFILEANWASGKVLREYTLLLDPLEYVPKKQRVQMSSASKSKASHPAKSSEFVRAAQGEQHYGPVQTNDNLWTIAEKVGRPYHADVHQTMVAIARKNPSAFIDNNLNGLKQGVTLTLPSKEEIFSLSASEAMARTAEHQQAWRQGKRLPGFEPLPVVIQAQAEKPLTLVMPHSNQDSGQQAAQEKPARQASNAWTGSAMPTQAPQPSQDRLLMIEETLDTLKQTNQSLQQQQALLQKQNSQLMAALSQKDNQIEQLTQSLNEFIAQSKAKVMGVAQDAGPAISGGMEPQKPQASSEMEPQEPEAIKTEGTTEPTAPTDMSTPSTPPEPEKTKMAQLPTSGNQPMMPVPEPGPAPDTQGGFSLTWLALLAFGALGLGGAGYEVYRRRFKHNFDSFGSSSDLEPLRVETSGDDELDERTSKEDIDDALSVFGDGIDEADYVAGSALDEIQDNLEPRQHEDTLQREPTLEDILSEADVYMAYEKYDQAEHLLKDFVKHSPEAAQAHLKLLELYEKTANFDAFQDHIQTIPKGLFDSSPEIFQKIQKLLEGSLSFEKASVAQEDHEPSADLEYRATPVAPPKEPEAQKSMAAAEEEEDPHKPLEFSFKPSPAVEGEAPESSNEERDFLDLDQEYSLEMSPASEEESKAQASEAADQFDEFDNDLPEEDDMTTKLALAQAYVDLGDKEGAMEHLEVILKQGDAKQKELAQKMVDQMNGS